MTVGIPVAVVVGISVGLAASRLALAWLKRLSIMDIPNHRSSHSAPVVRGGGIGLGAGGITTMCLANSQWVATDLAIGLGVLAFGAIGLVDDISGGLSVRLRMVLQVILGVASVALLEPWAKLAYLEVAFVLLGGSFWIVSFVNVVNFMDGINGITCAQAIAAGITFGFIGSMERSTAIQVAGFALAAGTIGFAPFNFPTARMFLGDVGSYLVGAWISILMVAALLVPIPVVAIFAPVIIYLADTSTTLIKRIRSGKSWKEAHREHVYQRLVDAGHSHVAVTTVVFIAITVCSLLGLVSLTHDLVTKILADFGIIIVITVYLLLPKLDRL